jgi:hypothetical protein
LAMVLDPTRGADPGHQHATATRHRC